MTVTVYTKPSCVQCNATYRALDSKGIEYEVLDLSVDCLLYTSPSPRDGLLSRMPSSA